MMWRYGVLQESMRGFFMVLDGKFYFIDRRCKNKLHKGFCKFVVASDHGNYGFIMAENVETIGFYDAVKQGFFSEENFGCERDRYIKSAIIVRNVTLGLHYIRLEGSCYVFVMNEEVGRILPVELDNDCMKNIDSQFAFVEPVATWFLADRVSGDYKECDDFKMSRDAVIDKLLPHLHPYLNEYSIYWSEKRGIAIVRANKFKSSYTYAVYNNDLYDLSSVNLAIHNKYKNSDTWEYESKVIKDSTYEDITRYVLSKIYTCNLCIGSYPYMKDDPAIVYMEVFIPEVGVLSTRKFLSTSHYTPEKYEEVKCSLEESKKEYDDIVNKIGKFKSISTSTKLGILRRLNEKKFQLGERV